MRDGFTSLRLFAAWTTMLAWGGGCGGLAWLSSGSLGLGRRQLNRSAVAQAIPAFSDDHVAGRQS